MIKESTHYWQEEVYGSLDEIVKKDAINRWIDKLFPDLKGMSVLDVGAGGGIWTRYWLDKGCKVTAVDTSVDSVRINKEFNHDNAEILLADMITADLGKKFDIIFAKDILEHVKPDMELLKNFNKHLKPDGRLMIFTHNSFSVNYYIEGFYHYLGGNVWIGYHPDHVRFYRPDKLDKKLREAGLEPIHYFGSYHIPYRFLSTALFRKVFEFKAFHVIDYLHLNCVYPFNHIGWSLGVVARKINE